MSDASHTVYEQLQLFLSAGLLAIAVSWLAWRRGFYRFPNTDETPSKIYLWQLLGAFSLFLILMVLIVPMLSVAWLSVRAGHIVDTAHLELDSEAQVQLNIFAILLSVLSILVYTGALGARTWNAVWGQSAFKSFSRIAKDWAIGSVTWLFCFPLVIVLGQLMAMIVTLFDLPKEEYEQVAVRYLKMTMENPILLGVMSFLLVAAVPLVEELLFRGFLQTWLKQHIGRARAIFATALIFALFHFSMSQGFYNFELLLSLFVLASFLGFLYERQQSLWAPIGLHATFNLISVMVIITQAFNGE